eukprot:276271_1
MFRMINYICKPLTKKYKNILYTTSTKIYIRNTNENNTFDEDIDMIDTTDNKNIEDEDIDLIVHEINDISNPQDSMNIDNTDSANCQCRCHHSKAETDSFCDDCG